MAVAQRFESDGEAEKSREICLALLEHEPEPFSRHSFHPGHFTCTGVALHPSGEAFALVHHGRLNRWLLPGGHVEAGDETLAGAAAREVLEETGLTADPSVAPRFVGLDVHPIPPKKGEPLHLHHDLIWAFRAADAELTCSEESHEVRWCLLGEMERYGLAGPIRRAVERSLR